VRTTGNLHAATGEHSGWPSVQLVLGGRIKPLAEYAVAELRYGPNWRLGSEDGRPASLWTHAVLALEHNNTYARQDAASAGLGVNARWWLREDAHRSGRSWLELSLQYRARLAGDSRNSGWVLRATWNY